MLRTTPQQFVSNAIRYTQIRNQNLVKLQNQIATGLKVRVASDEPIGYSTLLRHKALVSRIDVDLTNIEAARSKLNQSVSQLLQARDAFSRARVVALDDFKQFEDTTPLANEIEEILELILDIANTNNDGVPLYGGTTSVDVPFEIVARDASGRIAEIQYVGSDDRSSIAIGERNAIDVNYSGAEVFQSFNRQETLFFGDTGAMAGTGTDSATDRGELTISHTSTVFAVGSGLQPGTSSVTGDTIIGAHVLNVDEINQTLSLNNGPVISYTPGDTDVAVLGNNGEQVFVDTSAIVAGFVGTVNLTGNGTASMDGGVTTTTINFSANQQLIDSQTGDVTNIDSTQIRRTGTEYIEYRGTSDVFQVLINLRNELLNTRGLANVEWQDAMGRRIEDLSRIQDLVLLTVGEQSVELENLDAVQTRLEDLQIENAISADSLEAADPAQSILQMQQEQTLLQFTYATSVQLMNTSLLDFIS